MIFASICLITVFILIFYSQIVSGRDEESVVKAVQVEFFSSGMVICLMLLIVLALLERFFYKAKLAKDYSAKRNNVPLSGRKSPKKLDLLGKIEERESESDSD
jgi:hypothetical protein